MNQDSESFYMELSVKSLANAEQFLKDSKLLIENNSYGHACSLAILGFEELAKVWCAYYLYLGIYEEQDKEIQILQSDHREKYLLTWESLQTFIFGELLEQIIDIEKTIKESNVTNEEKKILVSYFKKASQPRKLTDEEIKNKVKSEKKLKELKEKFQKDKSTLEKIRWRGFYVDFNLEKKKILNTPKSFDNVTSLRFLSLFSDFLRFTKEYINEIIDNLDNPELQKTIKKTRSNAKILRKLMKE